MWPHSSEPLATWSELSCQVLLCRRVTRHPDRWLVPCGRSHNFMGNTLTRLGSSKYLLSFSTHLALLHLYWSKGILSIPNHPILLVLFGGYQRVHWCAEEKCPQESGNSQPSFSASSRGWTLCLSERKAVLLHKLISSSLTPSSAWQKDILCYKLLFCSL